MIGPVRHHAQLPSLENESKRKNEVLMEPYVIFITVEKGLWNTRFSEEMVYRVIKPRRSYHVEIVYMVLVVVVLIFCILRRNTFEMDPQYIGMNKESISIANGECPPPKKVSFSDRPLPLTALISFPGSGNTWTRTIIEKVTGIATGSVYCAERVRDVFIGECSHGRDVVVTKTHRVVWQEDVPFERAVILIRNPHHAMISVFNLAFTGSKTAIAPPKVYQNHFDKYTYANVEYWEEIYDSWAKLDIPKYVLVYEKMETQPFEEIKKLLQFLGIPVPDKTIKCALQMSEGKYHRKRKISFDPWSFYTKRVNETIKKSVKRIEQTFKIYKDINYL